MIIPVRCISCGRVIGEQWNEFKSQVESGKKPKEVLDSLGIERYCCRAHMITHVELIQDIAKFKDKVLPR